MALIQVKRTLSTELPATLQDGEPLFTEDTKRLYFGDKDGNLNLVNQEGSDIKAGQADKLTNSRNFSISGDGTAPNTAFDGTGDVALNLTLKNSGVAAGEYTKVTANAKGIVTSGSQLTADDIPALPLNKITDSTNIQLKSEKSVANGYAGLDENGKVLLEQIPDVIAGQLTHAGQWNATTALADLTTAGKAILGTDLSQITLTNDTTAITGYSANQGNYYITRTAGTFAGIEFRVGDWLVANENSWDIIVNTDAVTGVKGDSESVFRTGNINLTAGNVGAEPAISAGTTSQYLRGDKTWSGFEADTRSTLLTGLSSSNLSDVVATDTILAGIGKLQAKINLLDDSSLTDVNITANTGLSRSKTGSVITLSGLNATTTVKGVMLLGATGGAEAFKAAGTISQYLRGDKAWTDFNASTRAVTLTGLSTSNNAAVVAADTVLVSIGKLQAQINSGFSIPIASNTSLGAVQGSTVNGEIAIKTGGTMSLNGYAAINTSISDINSNISTINTNLAKKIELTTILTVPNTTETDSKGNTLNSLNIQNTFNYLNTQVYGVNITHKTLDLNTINFANSYFTAYLYTNIDGGSSGITCDGATLPVASACFSFYLSTQRRSSTTDYRQIQTLIFKDGQVYKRWNTNGTYTAWKLLESKESAEFTTTEKTKLANTASTTNMVTTDTAQTISGAKTFSSCINSTVAATAAAGGVILGRSGTYTGGLLTFYEGDANGGALAIQAGGTLYLGGGESATNLKTALGISNTTESTYLTSDVEINFAVNCQTIANRRLITLSTAGALTGLTGVTATTFTGALSGNANTATTLATARTIQTNLGSTSSASFNGSANITPGVTGTLGVGNGGTGLTANPSMLTNLASTTAASVLAASPRPGVTGTLGVANGGTGNTTGNAATATVLQTGRTIRTNLASTSAPSFNGSANITPGVTGTLGIANGGTGTTTGISSAAQTALDKKADVNKLSNTIEGSIGWLRIAASPSNITNIFGLFKITWEVSDSHGSVLIAAGQSYGSSVFDITQLSMTSYETSLGFNQIRIVYNSTYNGNYAYLEIYKSSAANHVFNIELLMNDGWALQTPGTGSIPSGYSSKTLAFGSGVRTTGDMNAAVFHGALSGNAATATTLQTGRTIQTNLASTSSSSFNGSTNITPGVTGILSAANGGTGSNATTAGALYRTSTSGAYSTGTLPIAQGGTGATATPSIIVNLASTSGASPYGSAPRPGVTGMLPQARGGTGYTTLTAALNALPNI